MTILITGGAGFIGSHTVLSFLQRGSDVVILDNLSNSHVESINRIEKIVGKRPVFYEGDILDRVILSKILSKHKISSVVHFAGLKSVAESIKSPILYYKNNVSGTLVLLEEMLNFGIKKLIFSSSATVYGEPESIPLDESCRIGGTTNPYGKSKLMVENILQDFCAANREFSLISLRYFNPIGAHCSGMIGENPNGVPNNLLPYILQVAIGKLDKLSIFGGDYPTKDGTGVRDYIHVMDLANGHLCAIDHIDDRYGYRAYNLGTGIGYSVLDIIKEFEAISGKIVNYDIIPRRKGDIAECWSNPKLAEKEIGWKAEKDLRCMLKDAWAWQIKNPNGYFSTTS
ncbi:MULTISPECIES: UDP-glucose 4-epimerase GalE [Pectobacterium]|uniref:UDP-glucose 4-epimerase GalE n=1 Tax=Pectobacterium TaxID=122277 RepID=UPI0019699638|nr:UDP-glucose 4-epimerase GalE [Pectobacterium brasiliense]MBN3069741.1 UDP-glucose 4-epimerase GalE [Pectobacterium brasiliense]MBN3246791.1 UDP-glucose 4-epimerase GalE [Pectobacterium brasiliense]